MNSFLSVCFSLSFLSSFLPIFLCYSQDVTDLSLNVLKDDGKGCRKWKGNKRVGTKDRRFADDSNDLLSFEVFFFFFEIVGHLKAGERGGNEGEVVAREEVREIGRIREKDSPYRDFTIIRVGMSGQGR